MLKQIESIQFKKKDFFLTVDEIERKCLSTPDFSLHVNDIAKRPNDIDINLSDDDKEFTEDSEISQNSSDEFNESPPEVDDWREMKAKEFFSLLEDRKNILGDLYPFEISNNDTLSLDFKNLNEKEWNYKKLYIFLLLCNSMKYFNENILSYRNSLAASFEKFCLLLIRRLFPNFSIEGIGTGFKNHGILSGNGAFEKIECLASLLNTRLKSFCREEHIREVTSVDGKLDIVGWFNPIKDKATHMPLIFLQCACSADDEQIFYKNFDYKKTSSKFETIIENPMTFMLSPLCYRARGGALFDPSYANGCFFDRIRLMLCLEHLNIDVSSQEFKETLGALPLQIVNKALHAEQTL